TGVIDAHILYLTTSITSEALCKCDDQNGRQAQVYANHLAKYGQGKVQPEQLYQQGSATEDFNEGNGKALDKPVVRELSNSEDKGADGPQNGGVDRQLNGYPRPLQEGGAVTEPVHVGLSGTELFGCLVEGFRGVGITEAIFVHDFLPLVGLFVFFQDFVDRIAEVFRAFRKGEAPPAADGFPFDDWVGKFGCQLDFVAFCGQFTGRQTGGGVRIGTARGHGRNGIGVVGDGHHAVFVNAECLHHFKLIGASHDGDLVIRVSEIFVGVDVFGVALGNQQALTV